MEEEKEKKIVDRNEMKDKKDNNNEDITFWRFAFRRIIDNFRKRNDMFLIFFLPHPTIGLVCHGMLSN